MKRPAHFEALAFRVWAYANPLGWDCTAKEIADALGVDWHRVNWALRQKGWSGRLRVPVARVGNRFTHSTAKFDVADILLGKSDFDTAQFMEAEE